MLILLAAALLFLALYGGLFVSPGMFLLLLLVGLCLYLAETRGRAGRGWW